MRPEVAYFQGHGWHCGRLLLWPFLVIGAGLSAFPIGVAQAFVQLVTHTRLPWGLLVTGYLAWRGWWRLERKKAGEPFSYYGPWWSIPRNRLVPVLLAENPRRFWMLYAVECGMIATSLLLQGAVLVSASRR